MSSSLSSAADAEAVAGIVQPLGGGGGEDGGGLSGSDHFRQLMLAGQRKWHHHLIFRIRSESSVVCADRPPARWPHIQLDDDTNKTMEINSSSYCDIYFNY